MQGGLNLRRPPRRGFEPTTLERRALRLATGAPVTGAVVRGTMVAAGFGDGTVRLFRPASEPVTIHAHRGAVLSIAADALPDAVLTGGDDARFLRIAGDGGISEIASFGTRWVDCVAAGPGWRACSSGRTVQLWRVDGDRPLVFDHPSTVGGLAFDPKGRKLAAAHYGGATVWERGEKRWKPSRLVWKGSHGAVIFSPDGRFLVTAMQENVLHGWRLRDKADMRMSGYPAKVKSFAWVGSVPFLATSGCDEVVCWPFDESKGPMGRAPIAVAYGGKQLCTAVTGMLGIEGVFAGFADGAVLAGRFAAEVEDLVVKGSGGAAITALAVTPEGWLFIGDAAGTALWARLGELDAP